VLPVSLQLLRLSFLSLSESLIYQGEHYRYIWMDFRLHFSARYCGTEVSLLVSEGIHFVNSGSQFICSTTRLL